MAGKRRRQQAGGGGISQSATKAGPRFLIKYPVLLQDGTKRVVLKRGFTARREAATAPARARQGGRGGLGGALQATARRLRGRMGRRATAQRIDTLLLPEEHPAAHRALPRRHAADPAHRLHDLRHTHARLLLAAGEPVKVVSERLGHASATITLTVYQHANPGIGRQAAERFAVLLRG
jgi:hypothetical protein